MMKWDNMPEFEQPKKVEHQKIIIRFKTEQDVQEFAKLIGQPLTPKTKSIWFPKLDRNKYKGYYYGD